MESAQTKLFVPDRFDILFRRAPGSLGDIIVPVDDSLRYFDDIYAEMESAGRGRFVIMKADSGSGKSTFLRTINLFREGVESLAFGTDVDVAESVKKLESSGDRLRVVVIEGREALTDLSSQDLEKYVHSINAFLRTEKGERTVIVWPCNTDDLVRSLSYIANKLGADALLGVGDPVYLFCGPSKSRYIQIAQQTISTLNEGASLSDLGISEDRAVELLRQVGTIGRYLGLVRDELNANRAMVSSLLAKERCHLWVVVVAGNDPDNDVAALTRGSSSTADIERMLAVTQANIVEELKRYPEKLGILGSVLDVRIIYVSIATALSVVRNYASDELREVMASKDLSKNSDSSADARLAQSELALAFQGEKLGTRSRGKTGSNTLAAFEKLSSIASTNDIMLNKAVADSLVAGRLIGSYELEKDFGTGLTRTTDIYIKNGTEIVRLEMMWRKKTGRAEISNYTLTKIFNYGRAIGLL